MVIKNSLTPENKVFNRNIYKCCKPNSLQLSTKMETQTTADKVLMILLKEPFIDHTATSLSKILNITRQGIWKTLNNLSYEKLVSLRSVADTKKSAMNIKLNWENPITAKTLSLLLTKESLNYERWRFNFAELENNVKFLILFGSILINSKEADDIDVFAIVDKKNFKTVDEKILKIQTTQLKKIHLIDLTEAEFSQELKRPNKAYVDALKKGIILFGQENFIKFIKGLKK